MSRPKAPRMPAEWERHEATWLAFPHHRTDFPGKLAVLPWVMAEVARVLSQKEIVRLLCRDEREVERARTALHDAGAVLDRVEFHLVDTDRAWVRDSMPIWVKEGRTTVAVKFGFDGWSRYRDHRRDDAAGHWVARHFAPSCRMPRLAGRHQVLEGGSLDTDGQGTFLTTEECLVRSPRARFRHLGADLGGRRDAAERFLAEQLGAAQVIWLPDGIVGDDTSGHVDDFARFAPQGRVLVCHESRPRDPNHGPLRAAQRVLARARDARGRALEVVELPMPTPVYYRGERLPASYANFYVGNAAVLVPTFNDPHDYLALDIIGRCFEDRPTVGIYARDLVVGLGTLHCSTMQQPR